MVIVCMCTYGHCVYVYIRIFFEIRALAGCQGLEVTKVGVLNCDGLSDCNLHLADCYGVSISSCDAISASGFTLTNRNTYTW